jgi:hypothetical protein
LRRAMDLHGATGLVADRALSRDPA